MLEEQFDEEIIKIAEDKAIDMVGNGLYNRFNVEDARRIENAKVGIIGELVFEKILIKNSIPYNVDDITDYKTSNTDLFDFLINDVTIDIKVAKLSTKSLPKDSWTYGYPENQYPQRKDLVIVGLVNFNNNTVSFYGYISGQKISSFKVVSRNNFAGYNYQTPNHEFRYGDLNKNIIEKLKGI